MECSMECRELGNILTLETGNISVSIKIEPE